MSNIIYNKKEKLVVQKTKEEEELEKRIDKDIEAVNDFVYFVERNCLLGTIKK
jgi:hypothetical protein